MRQSIGGVPRSGVSTVLSNEIHDESEAYPADIERSEIDDEAVLELSAEHHSFFGEVAAEGHDHPDDLTEFEPLFHASARDRIE